MSDIVARLDAVIANLQEARADAEKCDKGKTGAPGTRVRKITGKGAFDLKEIRKAVIEARKAPRT